MNEGEGSRLGFLRPEVSKARETPQTNTINDVLKGFKADIQILARGFSPDWEQEGHDIAENFSQEFLCLLNPAAERIHLNGSQSIFVREALFKLWSFKGYPTKSPTFDEYKVLAVATYLNSLVLPERR
jgi:hypothetical protein